MAARPAFVGRRTELAALEDAWTAVAGGARQVVFIGGEPGAGKTRLMTEVALEAHRLGAAVLSGRCVADLGVPYQPFDEPARVLLDALTVGALVPRSAGSPPEDVARQLAALAGDDDADAGAAPRIDDRRARYDALVGCLRAVADRQPVVLALDDLHRAGSTALQLLGYIVERAPDLSLLILATHRTTVPDRSAELVDHVAALYRLEGVRRLDLSPLETESIIDYLVAQGRVPRRHAAPAAVLLRDSTGGNPFYLREVWRHLAASGGVTAVRDERMSTPVAINDALALRIRSLSAPQRATLASAAVLGEEVAVPELVPLLRAEDCLPALDDLTDAGLLEELPDQPGRYRFVHSLLRQATLDAMSSLERAERHERVALLLRARGASVRRLAHHFAGASVLGYAEDAVRYLTDAAEAADRSLAHAEAARLFEQAASHCADAVSRGNALLHAARSHLLGCEFREARDLYRQVADRGDVSLRLAAAIGFEEASWYTADSGPAAESLLVPAIRVSLVDESHPLWVPSLAGLARAAAQSGRQDEAEVLVSRAIEAARASDDAELIGIALSASMQVGIRPTVNDGKRGRAEELTDIAARTGRWIFLGPAAYHRSTLAYQQGDAAGLAAARVDLERTAVAAGQRYWSFMADCAAFGTALIEARFSDARNLAEQLFDLGGNFTGGEHEGLYGVQSFMLRRETGAVEQVRPLVSGTEPYDGHWLPALLALYTELDLAEPAGRLLRHLLSSRVRPEDEESAARPAALAFIAEAALALRDTESAAQVRPLLKEYSGLNLVMGPFAAVFGAADRYLGELDSLLGDEAVGHRFEAALDLDDRTGSVLHRAYGLTAWSTHARTYGDGRLATRLHKEATTLAERHGMVRVTARLGRATSHVRPGVVPGRLSERERQVLRLLGSGFSNREIAKALTISEHTAANHIRNIMTKTGCTNRTQAAMFASVHGLLD